MFLNLEHKKERTLRNQFFSQLLEFFKPEITASDPITGTGTWGSQPQATGKTNVLDRG